MYQYQVFGNFLKILSILWETFRKYQQNVQKAFYLSIFIYLIYLFC